MMWISCSSTSQRCWTGLWPGDWGGHWSGESSLIRAGDAFYCPTLVSLWTVASVLLFWANWTNNLCGLQVGCVSTVKDMFSLLWHQLRMFTQPQLTAYFLLFEPFSFSSSSAATEKNIYISAWHQQLCHIQNNSNLSSPFWCVFWTLASQLQQVFITKAVMWLADSLFVLTSNWTGIPDKAAGECRWQTFNEKNTRTVLWLHQLKHSPAGLTSLIFPGFQGSFIHLVHVQTLKQSHSLVTLSLT